MEKIKCAHTRLADIHKLVPNPRNPNKHPDEQIQALAKVIDFQGQRAPVVVSNRSNFVIKGHGRLQALKKLGWEKVAVDYQDYASEAEEYADMVADNTLAELSNIDEDEVREAILEIPGIDIETLAMPNFNVEELDELDAAIEGSETNTLQDRLEKYNEIEPRKVVILFEKQEYDHWNPKFVETMGANDLKNFKELVIYLMDKYEQSNT